MPWVVLEKEKPKPSVANDVLMSGVGGVAQGMDGLVGMFGDVRDMAGGALEWTADKVHPGAGKPIRKMFDKGPGGDLGRAVQHAQKTVISGGAQAAGVKPELAQRLGGMAPGMTPGFSAPSSRQVNAARTAATGPDHEPQTVGGEYARTLGQFTPGALAPGGAIARMANVVVPAVASETAGQATKGTKLEAPARLAAALAAGVPTAMAASSAATGGPASRILANNSNGATDAQIAEAAALMRDSPVRLSGAEAVQQITDNGTGMGAIQRVVEGTQPGRERFTAAMADRPTQVRDASTAVLDQIAPATPDPAALATRLQDTAEGALTNVRRDINNTARPHYDALPGNALPETDYAQLAADPSYAAALANLRGNPELNFRIASLPDNDLGVINEVVKQLDTMAENVTPQPANPNGSMQLASRRGDARELADGLASTNPDWTAARDIVATGRRDVLEPLQRGPLGRISKSADVGAQTGALFPAAPPENFSNTARTTVGHLGPEAGAELTRQHLANALNESTQNLQGGQNQYGGAKFVANVAGNAEQRAVLEGVLGDTAPDALPEWRRLARALEATGKRQQPGSQTAFNTEELKSLGTEGAVGQTVRNLSSLPFSIRSLGDSLQDLQSRLNSREIAEILLGDADTFEAAIMRARRARGDGGMASRVLAQTPGYSAQLDRGE